MENDLTQERSNIITLEIKRKFRVLNELLHYVTNDLINANEEISKLHKGLFQLVVKDNKREELSGTDDR